MRRRLSFQVWNNGTKSNYLGLFPEKDQHFIVCIKYTGNRRDTILIYNKTVFYLGFSKKTKYSKK